MAMVRAKKNIFSYVRELKPRKDTSRIEVRIVRFWRNYNKESGNTIEMVVVDKEGTRIHTSVGEQLIKKFDDTTRGRCDCPPVVQSVRCYCFRKVFRRLL
ncbi:unnamed protein product [Brassica napus]|uniref:(rape) hypothetical protein n=1 Tax=Brassica napus TaxID=3708 RepID=A0A816P3I7_BRANA|nr:unnamed protein product [Brassica napus]